MVATAPAPGHSAPSRSGIVGSFPARRGRFVVLSRCSQRTKAPSASSAACHRVASVARPLRAARRLLPAAGTQTRQCRRGQPPPGNQRQILHTAQYELLHGTLAFPSESPALLTNAASPSLVHLRWADRPPWSLQYRRRRGASQGQSERRNLARRHPAFSRLVTPATLSLAPVAADRANAQQRCAPAHRVQAGQSPPDTARLVRQPVHRAGGSEAMATRRARVVGRQRGAVRTSSTHLVQRGGRL